MKNKFLYLILVSLILIILFINISSSLNNFAGDGHDRPTYYVSDNFIQARLTNGTILNETYYHANGKLVAKKDNSGAKTYYHPDHLGSTTLVTNQSGDVVDYIVYMPYGWILKWFYRERLLSFPKH